MKKFLVVSLALLMTIGLIGTSHANVLTFDDIGTMTISPIPDGYGGFNWDQMGYLHGFDYSAGSGYDHGTVSGDYVAYNDYANVATVTDGIFDFNGAYLTGAWRDGLNITLTGFLGTTQLYSQTVVVDHTGPTWFNFNFSGIDQLKFESFGGVEVEGLEGSGAHFAMDNFTYTPVPEPATLLLLGSGLIGLAGFGRKKKEEEV